MTAEVLWRAILDAPLEKFQRAKSHALAVTACPDPLHATLVAACVFRTALEGGRWE